MQITVNQLLKFCQAQVSKGNGNKKIWISDDDEGNGYHELFYGFTEGETYINELFNVCCQDKPDIENIIILG